MAWWIWITLGICLCVVEIIVPSFFILFFGVGGIATGIVVAVGFANSFSLQLIVFTLLSILLLVFFRSTVMKFIERSDGKPEPDSFQGKWAVAKENIEPTGIGKVELRGSSWNGLNAGNSKIVEGESCQVQEVDGLKLVVISKSEIEN